MKNSSNLTFFKKFNIFHFNEYLMKSCNCSGFNRIFFCIFAYFSIPVCKQKCYFTKLYQYLDNLIKNFAKFNVFSEKDSQTSPIQFLGKKIY